MRKNMFQTIEIVIWMIMGVVILAYTQDMLMSIIYIFIISAAYSLFNKLLKKDKKINQ